MASDVVDGGIDVRQRHPGGTPPSKQDRVDPAAGAELEHVLAGEVELQQHVAQMDAGRRRIPHAFGNIQFEHVVTELLRDRDRVEIIALSILARAHGTPNGVELLATAKVSINRSSNSYHSPA